MIRIDDNMRDKVFTINDDGRICENGFVISNERVVLLLNEADFVREDLMIEKSRNDVGMAMMLKGTYCSRMGDCSNI